MTAFEQQGERPVVVVSSQLAGAQFGPAASREAAVGCRAQVFDKQSALWCLTPSTDDGTLHHK
jgi:hypothetical protein